MSKEAILKKYQEIDKFNPKAIVQRKILFNKLKQAGDIPTTTPYSDENYYDYIAKNIDGVTVKDALNENKNGYLLNIFNKIAWIDNRLMIGDRNELFQRGLKSGLMTGDSIDVQYDQIMDTFGFDQNKFVPDKVQGGDKIFSNRISLSSVVGDDNPDKRTQYITIDISTIQQALLPSLTNGLPDGYPSYFFNILKRTWEKQNFERFRKLVSMTGGIPSKTSWFDSDTTFTKNGPQFVEITTPVTDAKSLVSFLEQVYDKAADLEGEYNSQYNPAKIEQINNTQEMSVYFDKSLKAYWKTTSAVLFNSEKIDFKENFKNIDFFKMLPSSVDPEIVKIKAILFVDLPGKHPYIHQPFAQEGEGIRRYTQFWVTNTNLQISDHFWCASGMDLSVNAIVFYEKTEAATSKQEGKK